MRLIRLLAILATFVGVGVGTVLWIGPEQFANISIHDGAETGKIVYTWHSGTWPSIVLLGVIAGSIAAVFVAVLLRAVAGPSGRQAESRW